MRLPIFETLWSEYVAAHVLTAQALWTRHEALRQACHAIDA